MQIKSINAFKSEVKIHAWGSFSEKGKKKQLGRHEELLQNGAIGLAEDNNLPPINLLKQGFSLNEIGNFPVLLAPRDLEIQGEGMVRESVETLRAGWHPDPVESEILPLGQLLQLHNRTQHYFHQ